MPNQIEWHQNWPRLLIYNKTQRKTNGGFFVIKGHGSVFHLSNLNYGHRRQVTNNADILKNLEKRASQKVQDSSVKCCGLV